MSRDNEENNNNDNNVANGNYNVPIDEKPRTQTAKGKIGRKVTLDHFVNEKDPNLNRNIYQDTYKPYTIFGKLYFHLFFSITTQRSALRN